MTSAPKSRVRVQYGPASTRKSTPGRLQAVWSSGERSLWLWPTPALYKRFGRDCCRKRRLRSRSWRATHAEDRAGRYTSGPFHATLRKTCRLADVDCAQLQQPSGLLQKTGEVFAAIQLVGLWLWALSCAMICGRCINSRGMSVSGSCLRSPIIPSFPAMRVNAQISIMSVTMA